MMIEFLWSQLQCRDIARHQVKGGLRALWDGDAQIHSQAQKLLIDIILSATACEAEDHHGVSTRFGGGVQLYVGIIEVRERWVKMLDVGE